MKKFIWLLNILLFLLIPTTILISSEDESIRYETDAVSELKMIKTTVLLDRSNKKKEIEEAEARKREEEERRLLIEQQEEERRKEAEIKALAIKSQESVTAIQTVEQVGSRESADTDSKDNVGVTTTVTVGSAEKAYVGYQFSGNMSAYGRDCCSEDVSKKGITASGFNIYLNGMYYHDSQYGKVRIIAANRNDFYLYSVVNISDPIDGIYKAIVLDRGDSNIGIGRKFVFDLVVESQSFARTSYGVHKNVSFEVLRIGK